MKLCFTNKTVAWDAREIALRENLIRLIPELSDPAHRTRRLQPKRESRVR